jgi:hypothetical protein
MKLKRLNHTKPNKIKQDRQKLEKKSKAKNEEKSHSAAHSIM